MFPLSRRVNKARAHVSKGGNNKVTAKQCCYGVMMVRSGGPWCVLHHQVLLLGFNRAYFAALR